MFYFWGRGPTGNLLCSSSYSSFPYLLLLFSVSFQSIPLRLQKVPCIAQFSSSVLFRTREEKRREENRRKVCSWVCFACIFKLVCSHFTFRESALRIFPFGCSKKKREAKGTHSVSVSVSLSVWKQPGVGVDEKEFCSVLFWFGLVWFLFLWMCGKREKAQHLNELGYYCFSRSFALFTFWVHFFCIFRSTQNTHAHRNGVLFRVSYL